ncbi:hypothetical protein FN976_20465 [Caenimonas sedimenti]|uniref:Uncharacterized protein n=1 Tax=Caenimonas sedimenti TaxID=2596921 RepID=A0A562ZL11_9BURK|nr:hypothetical protein [Caenimonas sedimenti]TWO69111.1 hypothetical protein FN976_20465 [Caenimonas sedimenti]
MALLPSVKLDPCGRIDVAASPPEVHREIREQAKVAAAALSNGISAVGILIPYAAPEFEDRTIGGDTVEALGWLLSELGVLGAILIEIALECSQCPSPRLNDGVEHG